MKACQKSIYGFSKTGADSLCSYQFMISSSKVYQQCFY